MELIAALIVLALFSGISFWQGTGARTVVLWLLTAAVSLIVAFLFLDKYSDYVGLAFSLILFAYGVFCIGQVFRGIAGRAQEAEE